MNYWDIVGDNVVQSLKYMLFGMAGIFVITAVIIGAIFLLNHFQIGEEKQEGKDE